MRNIITVNADKSKQYGEGDININSIFKMIKKLGIYFIIILLFAFLISVIEAYMNIPLYKSYIEKIWFKIEEGKNYETKDWTIPE